MKLRVQSTLLIWEMVELHVKIVECDISRTSIICNHNDLWNAIETIKFIIPQFATFILHIFFGDNSRFHILIRPFLISSVDIAAQRPLYYSLRFLFVKHCFVFAYNHASTSASVGGFQNKLTGGQNRYLQIYPIIQVSGLCVLLQLSMPHTF